MPTSPLSQLMRRWVYRIRPRVAAPARRPATVRLGMETFEERVVPAVLPPVTATEGRAITALFTGTSGFDPKAAVNPTNPYDIILARTTGTEIVLQRSLDGGTNWADFFRSAPSDRVSPGIAQPENRLLDPSVPVVTAAASQTYRAFTNVYSPSVAFGRDGYAYLTYVSTDATKANGAVVLHKFNMNFGGAEVDLDADSNDPLRLTRFFEGKVLYRWSEGLDAAFNPVVALDTNAPEFTDPGLATGLRVVSLQDVSDPPTNALGTSSYISPNRIRVKLSGAVTPGALQAALQAGGITVTGPNGAVGNLTVTPVLNIDPVTNADRHNLFDISFTPEQGSATGQVYRVSISGLINPKGEPMNQDGDLFNGELTGDTLVNAAITLGNPARPVVYVDTAISATTGKPLTAVDTMAGKAVYVAWNTNATAPTLGIDDLNASITFTPNAIFVAAARIDPLNQSAMTFSAPMPVNNTGVTNLGYFAGGVTAIPNQTDNHTTPRILFTPGNGTTPGSLVFAWSDAAGGQLLIEASLPDFGDADRPAVNATDVNGTVTGTNGAGAVVSGNGQFQDATQITAPAGGIQLVGAPQVVTPAGATNNRLLIRFNAIVNPATVQPSDFVNSSVTDAAGNIYSFSIAPSDQFGNLLPGGTPSDYFVLTTLPNGFNGTPPFSIALAAGNDIATANQPSLPRATYFEQFIGSDQFASDFGTLTDLNVNLAIANSNLHHLQVELLVLGAPRLSAPLATITQPNDPTRQSILLTFNRNVDLASFTLADIVRIVAPNGVIDNGQYTLTPVDQFGQPLAVGVTSTRYFRIDSTNAGGFNADDSVARYTIVLGPDIRPERPQNLDAYVPNAALGDRIVVLFQNRLLANGNLANTVTVDGLDAPTDAVNKGFLGIYDFSAPGFTDRRNVVGTVFDEQAARKIEDQANSDEYVGYFRPEGEGTTYGGQSNRLSDFNGLTAAELAGLYILKITDYVFDGAPPPTRPTQRVEEWGLKFTGEISNTGFGQEAPIFQPGTVTPVTSIRTGVDTGGAATPSAAPPTGIGSGLSIAVDTSLGAYTRFAGRIYAAYTAGTGNNTNVFIKYSDDNGETWTNGNNPLNLAVAPPLNDDSLDDHFTEGNRAQFMPTVTVDPLTGTVVVTWYDARNDPTNTRVATYIATSIDGGNTFSVQTFLNTQKTAYDAIAYNPADPDAGKVVLEAIPSSLPNVGANGVGSTQAVVAVGGNIVAFWTGNANGTGAQVYTSTAKTAGGPRVISSDMGPVTSEANLVDPRTGRILLTYNTRFGADGTRLIDGFVITFDRPIDPTSFTAADIQVFFRSPSASLAAAGDLIAIESVVQYTEDTFFVRFATPQGRVGTYSYAVGPEVRDLIRNEGFGQNIVIGSGPGRYIPEVGVVTSPITIPAVGSPQTIVGLTVSLELNHQYDTDLVVTLIAPDGTRVLLIDRRGQGGPGRFAITLDDFAFRSLGNLSNPFAFPTQEYTGTYTPDDIVENGGPGLSALVGRDATGVWRLEINDVLLPDDGSLVTWSLNITRLAPTSPDARAGNNMDQDADGFVGEAGNDTYSTPRSTTGQPFTGPYAADTQPLIVPGPYLVKVAVPGQFPRLNAATYVPAVPATPVLPPVRAYVRLNFDRDVLPSSLTAADIATLVGPSGPITITGFLPVRTAVVAPGATFADILFDVDIPQGLLTGADVAGVFNSSGFPVGGTITVTQLSPRAFRIGFSAAAAADVYTFSFFSLRIDGLDANGATTDLATRVFALRKVDSFGRVYDIGPAGTYTVAVGADVQTPDNLVLSTGATQIELTFDRLIDPTTFTVADIIRFGGPAGTINPNTITIQAIDAAGNATTAPTARFRLSFPRINQSGPYSLEISPDIRAALNSPETVVVLSAGATFVDVTFDRDVAPGSVTGADVISVAGPGGLVAGPYTLTQLGPRTFRVGFAAAPVGGQYVIEFRESANLRLPNSGAKIDSNKNAGLAVLRGGDPVNGVVTTRTYSTTTPVVILPNRTVAATVTVAENFVITQNTIEQIKVRLDISYQNTRDLIIDLVAPDGTRIRLATRAGGQGQTVANYTGTVFSDFGTTNIQNGVAPFDSSALNLTYTPQVPLSALIGKNAGGVWRLEVFSGPAGDPPVGPARINSFSLLLPGASAGTGLGEANGDKITVGLRIYNLNPDDPVAYDQWTPVGSAANDNNGLVGQATAFAIDPSDPTGNTAYAGGASGGVWRTTNFLTTDPAGPTWVPLTDFGRNSSLEIASIAVFGRNGDPNQSVIFAVTGQGYTNSAGVGVLRSVDGGRTWQVLDSSVNAVAQNPLNPTSKTPLSFNDARRDHVFVGATGYEIVVDPVLSTATGGIVAYLALSGNAAQQGLWRTLDGGDTWTRILANGDVTDIVLSENGQPNGVGNRETLYVAVRGDGVYKTNTATSVALGGLTRMNGGDGNPLIFTPLPGGGIDPYDVNNSTFPTANIGEIKLAAPALVAGVLEKVLYDGWLYAAVADTAGGFLGLFMTKDGGANWTRVRLPSTNSNAGVPGVTGSSYGTNDETQPNHDPAGGFGNTALDLAVDPTNPNVVYVGSAGFGYRNVQYPGGGLIRVDVTTMKDAQSFVIGNNSDPAGTVANPVTTGGATSGAVLQRVIDPVTGQPTFIPYGVDFLNLARDPANKFLADSPIPVQGGLGGAFVNDGTDTRWRPFNASPTTLVHRLLTVVDPLTGLSRLIVATDNGIYSAVDNGDGTIRTTGVGFAELTSNSRSGNLQLGKYDSGAIQTSQLAADLAGAMFYGTVGSTFIKYPTSGPDATQSGDTDFATGSSSLAGPAPWVAVDPTGSGYSYGTRPSLAENDFFRVFAPGVDLTGPGSPQTGTAGQTLFNPGSDLAQWGGGGVRFSTNPRDGQALIIGSLTGRVYVTTNRGLTWVVRATPANTGNAAITATAFGAPNATASETRPVVQPNNFLYAGTAAGRVFVTLTGSGPWRDITGTGTPGVNALDGSAIQSIQANPQSGRFDVYVVTRTGVYYCADVSAPTITWTNITGNLFNLTRPATYGVAAEQFQAMTFLTALAVDWRVEDRRAGASVQPTLYVAGDGGVFRLARASAAAPINWRFFPDTGDGAAVNGGYLPNAVVTDLDLSIGDIDPLTGLPKAGSTGMNMLLATTDGRGQFAIRLDQALPSNAFVSGPKVVSVVDLGAAGDFSRLEVTFDKGVSPDTIFGESDLAHLVALGTADVILTNVGTGERLPVSVRAVPNVVGGVDQRNKFVLSFARQTTFGQYRLVIGEKVTDSGGQRMNQDGDNLNGESTINPATGVSYDAYVGTVFLNNTAPTITPPASPTLGLANTTISVPFAVGDAEQGPNGVTVTVSSGNPTLVANSGLVLSGTGANRTLTITPNVGQAGSAVITLVATDSLGKSTTVTFTYQINVAPVLAFLPDVTLQNGQSATVTAVATDANPGDTIRYEAKIAEQVAFDLDRLLGLQVGPYGTFTNATGVYGEKYILSIPPSGAPQSYYFILPNGELWKWGGGGTASTLFNGSALAGILDSSYYLDLNKLTGADPQFYVGPYGLFQNSSGIYHEKFILTPQNGYFLILPNGQLFKWGGGTGANLLVGSTLFDTLTQADYDSVTASSIGTLGTKQFFQNLGSVSVAGDQVTVTPDADFVGSFRVIVTAFDDNGGRSTRSFQTTATILGALPNITLPHSPNDSSIVVPLSPNLAYDVTINGNTPANLAAALDQRFAFRFTGNFFQNARGGNEKYVFSDNADQYFFILPNGQVWKWGQQAGLFTGSTQVAQLDPSYWADPSLLYNAPPPSQSVQQLADATAYALDKRLDFTLSGFSFDGSRYGREKYLFSNNPNLVAAPYFFITPEGQVWRWGQQASLYEGSILIAVLDPSYYENPSLLVNAVQPATPAVTVVGGQLIIAPPAGYYGTFTVTVSARVGDIVETKTFTVTRPDSLPTVPVIVDQTTPRQTAISVPVGTVADANFDGLTYSVTVQGYDRAYEAQQRYGFVFRDSYYYNATGRNEKWVWSTVDQCYYFLVPSLDGLTATLFRDTPNSSPGTTPGTRVGVAVGTLDIKYWANPQHLYSATTPPIPPAGVTAVLAGGAGTLPPILVNPNGYVGTFRVTLTVTSSVGPAVTRSFLVTSTNAAPVFTSIPASQNVGGTNSAVVTVNASDPNGNPVTFSAEGVEKRAFDLDTTFKFTATGPAGNEYYSATATQVYREKYVYSTVQGVYYFILPNGELWKWGGGLGAGLFSGNAQQPGGAATPSQYVTTLDPSYYANPAKLIGARNRVNYNPVTISPVGNQVTVTRSSAAFFGTVRVRVTAIDDNLRSTDQYFDVVFT